MDLWQFRNLEVWISGGFQYVADKSKLSKNQL